MDNLIEPFRAHLRDVTHCAPGTVERYSRELKHFVRFLADDTGWPGVTLEAVDAPRIIAFLRQYADERGEPSKPAWNVRLAALRAFYDWMITCRRRVDNPAHEVTSYRLQVGGRVPMSLKDFVAVGNAIVERASPLYRSRNLAIIDTFLYTGLRVSSLVSLNVAQLDFMNYWLHEVVVKRDKTMSIPMNDQLRASLEHCLADRSRFRRAADEQAVFLSDRGTRMTARTVRDMIATYARLGGILRPVSPHNARHGSGTAIGRIAGDPRLAQHHLGHESLETTQIYLHLDDDAWRCAIRELGLVVDRERAAGKGGEPGTAEARQGAL